MKFKKGDRVRFLDEAGEAIFVAYAGDAGAIVEVNGVEIPHPLDQLLPAMPVDAALRRVGVKDVDRKQKSKGNEMHGKEPGYRIIDLHADRLNQKFTHGRAGSILLIQLDVCRRELDAAIARGDDKIVFIHGVGEGVLKEEIIKMFRQYGYLSWEDAAYREYGHGATEVCIHHGASA